MSELRNAYTKKLLLEPLRALFGELKAGAEPLYLDALKSYSDTELEDILVHLRDNFRPAKFEPFPSVERIREARGIVAGKKGGGSPARTALMLQEFGEAADKVMRSPFGQMALREGWGHAVFVEARRTGRTDWRPDDADRLRAGNQAAIDAACRAEVEKNHNPIMAASARIFAEMQRRERELAAKYLADAGQFVTA